MSEPSPAPRSTPPSRPDGRGSRSGPPDRRRDALRSQVQAIRSDLRGQTDVFTLKALLEDLPELLPPRSGSDERSERHWDAAFTRTFGDPPRLFRDPKRAAANFLHDRTVTLTRALLAARAPHTTEWFAAHGGEHDPRLTVPTELERRLTLSGLSPLSREWLAALQERTLTQVRSQHCTELLRDADAALHFERQWTEQLITALLGHVIATTRKQRRQIRRARRGNPGLRPWPLISHAELTRLATTLPQVSALNAELQRHTPAADLQALAEALADLNAATLGVSGGAPLPDQARAQLRAETLTRSRAALEQLARQALIWTLQR